MIAYADHPEGGPITDLEGLRRALRTPKLFVSLIVLKEAPELLEDAATAWAGVGTPRIAEAAYAYITQYIRGLLSTRELLAKLVELFPEMEGADVLALQRALKIGTGMTTCDMGAAVFVQNPLAPTPGAPPRRVVAEAPKANAYLVVDEGPAEVYDLDTMCVVPYMAARDPALLHPLQAAWEAGYSIRTRGEPRCYFYGWPPAAGGAVAPRALARLLGLRPCV
ncbi:MAG: hypothetical protein TU35_001950 [Thermoproteus sp. AZ2]|uniref:Uncharacterized protein n=1 Tax=Thermoproteus sp. AZ2 TaxID=1609232 RepID=A0ACC6UYY0_9CREN|nr:MAG: hypothetical protein TU35_08735 [Thermoproteus sp. AZ2]